MDELIDVLDENGLKTGQVVTRKEVHKRGLCHKVVVVTVVDKNGNILMQQRSKNVEIFKECWDVSAAGHISAGEDSLEAAVRELKEEVNIQAKSEDLKLLLQYKEIMKISDDYIDNLIFDCYLIEENTINLDSIEMQESEVEQVKLCTFDEVMELVNARKVFPRDRFYEKLFEYFRNN